jgi:hypothetical protein
MSAKKTADAENDGQFELFETAKPPKAKPNEVFLTTISATFIREEPYKPLRQFYFHREAVRFEKRDKYLLIGFDTEYQSLQETFTDEDVKKGRARYEVLSYQFFALNDNGAQWTGIAIPDKGKRLSPNHRAIDG